MLSPQLKAVVSGIEQADSITRDAHKWLSVPIGAAMFFCRHPEAIKHAFLGDSSFPPQYLAVLLYRFNWYHSTPIPFVREAFSLYPIFTFEHFKRMISITEPEQEVLRIGEEYDAR